MPVRARTGQRQSWKLGTQAGSHMEGRNSPTCDMWRGAGGAHPMLYPHACPVSSSHGATGSHTGASLNFSSHLSDPAPLNALAELGTCRLNTSQHGHLRHQPHHSPHPPAYLRGLRDPGAQGPQPLEHPTGFLQFPGTWHTLRGSAHIPCHLACDLPGTKGTCRAFSQVTIAV